MVLLTQNFQYLWSLVDKNDSQIPKNDQKIRTLDIIRNTPTLYHSLSDFGNDLRLMISKMILFIFQKIKKAQKALKNDQKNLGH